MADDLPPDVRAVLVQLLAEGREALAAGDREVAARTVTTAETVATNKLPEGELRDHLLHGCDRVEMLLDPEAGDEDVETDAAGEYIAAMRRRLPDAE